MSVTFTKFIEADQAHTLLREVSALQRCKFHGVAKYVRAEIVNDGYYLTTVYGGKPLLNTLHQLDESTIHLYIVQILNIVSYCHGMGVYHRDIKPDNIVVDKGDLTVIDFGTARHKVGNELSGNIRITSALMTYIGYAAPEILEGNIKSFDRVDEWAIGVILYNMIKRKPFVSSLNTLDAIKRKCNKGLNLEKYTKSKRLIDLCTGLLQFDSSKRISCDEALGICGAKVPKAIKPTRYNSMFAHSNSIEDKSRWKLFDWLEEVRDKFDFTYPTLDNACRLIDNYTQLYNIDMNEYQLLGCVCMSLSSYLFEVDIPSPEIYIKLTANSYTYNQFIDLEQKVIKVFNFDLDRM